MILKQVNELGERESFDFEGENKRLKEEILRIGLESED